MTRIRVWSAVIVLAIVAVAVARLAASDPGTGDWPMWGGTPIATWCRTRRDWPRLDDVKTRKETSMWSPTLVADLRGTPSVAGRHGIRGTNNEGLAIRSSPANSRRADGVSRTDGEVHVAAHAAKLEAGPARTTGRIRVTPFFLRSSTAQAVLRPAPGCAVRGRHRRVSRQINDGPRNRRKV